MNGFIWGILIGYCLTRSLSLAGLSPQLFGAFSTLLTQTTSQITPEDRLIEGMDRGMRGDYKGAIAIFSRLIRQYPRYADAYYNRGLAKQKLGNRKGAIADYNRAIQLNPQFAEAYQSKGLLQQEQGDLAQSLANLQKAAALYQSQNNTPSYEELQIKIQELLMLKNQK